MTTLSNKLKMAVSVMAAMCCIGAFARPQPSKSAQKMHGAAHIVESAGAAAVGVAAVIGAVKGNPTVVATPAPVVPVVPTPAPVIVPTPVVVQPVGARVPPPKKVRIPVHNEPPRSVRKAMQGARARAGHGW